MAKSERRISERQLRTSLCSVMVWLAGTTAARSRWKLVGRRPARFALKAAAPELGRTGQGSLLRDGIRNILGVTSSFDPDFRVFQSEFLDDIRFAAFDRCENQS